MPVHRLGRVMALAGPLMPPRPEDAAPLPELAGSVELADFFQAAAAETPERAPALARWVVNELLRKSLDSDA